MDELVLMFIIIGGALALGFGIGLLIRAIANRGPARVANDQQLAGILRVHPSQLVREVTIKRSKQYMASAGKMTCYIDGMSVAIIRAGETVRFRLDARPHGMLIRFWVGRSHTVVIEPGIYDKHYSVKAIGFWVVGVRITDDDMFAG